MRVSISVTGIAAAMYLVSAGNTSILPFYFKPGGPVLVTNESLVAELTLTGHGRIWEIHISGQSLSLPLTSEFALVHHDECYYYDN